MPTGLQEHDSKGKFMPNESTKRGTEFVKAQYPEVATLRDILTSMEDLQLDTAAAKRLRENLNRSPFVRNLGKKTRNPSYIWLTADQADAEEMQHGSGNAASKQASMPESPPLPRHPRVKRPDRPDTPPSSTSSNANTMKATSDGAKNEEKKVLEEKVKNIPIPKKNTKKAQKPQSKAKDVVALPKPISTGVTVPPLASTDKSATQIQPTVTSAYHCAVPMSTGPVSTYCGPWRSPGTTWTAGDGGGQGGHGQYNYRDAGYDNQPHSNGSTFQFYAPSTFTSTSAPIYYNSTINNYNASAGKQDQKQTTADTEDDKKTKENRNNP